MKFIARSGFFALCCLAAFPITQLARGDSSNRPNFIVILADDMGYSDPGCFGGEMVTPALDRLATEGVRLTRFHNGGMCVVSRASLLTGQWWPRALQDFEKVPLLSEKLKAANYRTALIGKWHLSGHPMDRGFDHFYGFLDGFADHFTGSPSYRLDRAPFTDFTEDSYSSDDFTDRAIRFIAADSSPSDQPFFLYLSYQAPHNPLQAPKADILRNRGKYLAGWQAIREARFRRQKEIGIVPATASLPKAPQNLPDWASLTAAQRDLEDLRMAVYAAMVERMDLGIGRLLAALHAHGKSDNTWVIFMSDNGADSFSVMDHAMLQQNKLPGDAGSNWQPGTGWAHASGTPWRLYKISQHGGGITSGAIAWHGGSAKFKPGAIVSSPVHLIDVMPTFLELTAQPLGAAVAGESFASLLMGKAWQRKKPLFFQYMDNRAIRDGEWTLAEVDGSDWELFNTASDPLESKNLAKSNPEIVKKLSNRWHSWWLAESGLKGYQPESTATSPHYKAQGDRGTGVKYEPSAMPARLSGRYPCP
jgi:arylsulfatase A-like enzyme